MNNLPIVVLDTETTGLEPPIGIVEVAWLNIKYNEEFNEYYIDEDSFQNHLVNPERHISESASAKHGIRDEHITPDLPVLSEVPLPKEPCLLVCHNVPFDRPLVEPYMNIEAELCTLQLSRRLIAGCDNHKLGTLAAYLGLSNQLSHRAGGDITHCAELLMWMLSKVNKDITWALEFLSMPFVFNTMPWGKHKGLSMCDVPKGYLAWLIKQDLDSDMRTTLKYYLGVK